MERITYEALPSLNLKLWFCGSRVIGASRLVRNRKLGIFLLDSGHLSSPFIKSNQAILLNLLDFALKKQSEDNNLMAATSPRVLV